MINPTQPDSILSGILGSPNETRTIEFKPSIPWPAKSALNLDHKASEIIKSILGMSNLRDGGRIILGIEKDPTTKRNVLKGMEKEHLATYDPDRIFDLIAAYGDPRPSFEIANIEYDSRNFIVFSVRTFSISPVISTKSLFVPYVPDRPVQTLIDSPVLYTRTDKPATTKVTRPEEMREIIDLAVERGISKAQSLFNSAAQPLPTVNLEEEKIKFDSENLDASCPIQ